MKIDFGGRIAVVSGSTAGIGLAIAQGLAASGASVVVNGRSEARVKLAVDTVRQATPSAQVRGVAADLATAEGVERLTLDTPNADILVNNMGIFEAKPFTDITDADWQRFFDANVMSGVRLSRH